MTKRIFIISVSILLSISAISQQQTEGDKIIKKYFKAVGQSKLSKVNSIKASGKQNAMGMDFEFELFQKRPNKMRINVKASDMNVVQVVNGNTGFMINPMTGSTQAQDIPEVQLKALQKQANIDGTLYNYKQKGITIELEGEENFKEKPVYKLKISEKNGDKTEISHYFIDKTTYLLLKVSGQRNVNGMDLSVETLFNDYRKVEGVQVPFVTEIIANGMATSKVVIEDIKYNIGISDELFEKPKE